MFKDTNERIKIASELMTAGASLDKCVGRDNILWEACRSGAIQPVAFLLQTKQATEFVHRVDDLGQTVFHLTAELGHIEIFKLLLGFVANQTAILTKKRRNGEHVAHVAVTSPKGKLLLDLLAPKMNIFEPNEKGETILDIAIKFNVTNVTESLKARRLTQTLPK